MLIDSNKHKELWDFEKNGDLPLNVGLYNQDIKFWWKCSCGFRWEGTPHSITRKKYNVCRKCSSYLIDQSKIDQKRKGSKFKKELKLSGLFHGNWEIIKKVENKKKDGDLWLCRCKCGNNIVKRGRDFRSGVVSKSCIECYQPFLNAPKDIKNWLKETSKRTKISQKKLVELCKKIAKHNDG